MFYQAFKKLFFIINIEEKWEVRRRRKNMGRGVKKKIKERARGNLKQSLISTKNKPPPFWVLFFCSWTNPPSLPLTLFPITILSWPTQPGHCIFTLYPLICPSSSHRTRQPYQRPLPLPFSIVPHFSQTSPLTPSSSLLVAGQFENAPLLFLQFQKSSQNCSNFGGFIL